MLLLYYKLAEMYVPFAIHDPADAQAPEFFNWPDVFIYRTPVVPSLLFRARKYCVSGGIGNPETKVVFVAIVEELVMLIEKVTILPVL